MSKNLLDDEEFFGEVGDEIIPEDAEDEYEYIEVSDAQTVINDITAMVNKRFGTKSLVEIALTFEYCDHNGYSQWYGKNYIIKSRE